MSQLDPEELRRKLSVLAESSPEAAAEVQRVLSEPSDMSFSLEETAPVTLEPITITPRAPDMEFSLEEAEAPDMAFSLEEAAPVPPEPISKITPSDMQFSLEETEAPDMAFSLEEAAPVPPEPISKITPSDMQFSLEEAEAPDMEFSLEETIDPDKFDREIILSHGDMERSPGTDPQLDLSTPPGPIEEIVFEPGDVSTDSLDAPISLEAGKADQIMPQPEVTEKIAAGELDAPINLDVGPAEDIEVWKGGDGQASLLDEPSPSPPQPIAVHKQSWRENPALHGQGPPRGDGEDGPPREGLRGKEFLLALMSGLASINNQPEAAKRYRGALSNMRAQKAAQQKVSENERAMLGIDRDLTRGELDTAARYGWKPGGDDSAKWENAQLDRESRERMARERNQAMLESARLRKGRGKGGGGGGPGSQPQSSEARAVAILGHEGYSKLRKDYEAYQRGSAAVDTLSLQERLVDAYGEKAGLRMFGGAKGDHTTNTLTERGQRNNYEKQVEKLKYAMVASRRLQGLASQISQGGQNMKRYSAALDELASQRGAGGMKGSLSEDASALREAIVFMMGQIASTKGGAALTESEFSRLGGGTRVWQLGYGKEDQDFNSFWNMRGFGSGLSGKALAVANGSLTGADLHRFIKDVPRLLNQIRAEGMRGNPAGASADYRAGYTGMSKERVEEYVVGMRPDLPDDAEINVIGPVEGSSKMWRVEIDGEEDIVHME